MVVALRPHQPHDMSLGLSVSVERYYIFFLSDALACLESGSAIFQNGAGMRGQENDVVTKKKSFLNVMRHHDDCRPG